ncbi:hypothetical protein GH5_03354 [Leishmania sp. Ghana 2012 LV757]|uniref:hypothetical protein n=1 Tax=Leishmania sp. Ghana 2012 LV757 TaxID=2803181 RepID=UPI001B77DFDE|nr:hypothetical protein GH5_03354 [Leishmania sp. Ghana 2012 LV757]
MQRADGGEEADEELSASGTAIGSTSTASCSSCAPQHGVWAASPELYAPRTAALMEPYESIPALSSVPLSLPSTGAFLGGLGRTRLHISSGAGTANAQSCLVPLYRSDAQDVGRECTEAYRRESDNLTTMDATTLLPASDRDATQVFPSSKIPRMVFALLFFSSLVQGFSSSIISIFINGDLALQPVDVTQYWVYIGCTMWCQPIVGYISDAVVVVGERRRPLLLLAAVSNAVIYAAYSLFPVTTSSFIRFVALSMVSQFCTMGLYIPLNGLVVEVGRHGAETARERKARMSGIMSTAMVWRSAGSLGGAVLHTCLISFLPVRPLLGITGILFLVLVPVVLFTPRYLFLHASAQDDSFYYRVTKASRMVWCSFNIRDRGSDGVCFALMLAFVFVYTMAPDPGFVYYSYLYVVFQFPNWFYSMNGCIGHLGSIAGAWVFSRWMDRRARQEAHDGARVTLFFIFMISSAAWAAGYVTNLFLCTGFITGTLGVPAAVYVPVDNFFTSLVSRFAIMPTLVMAAEHAPRSFEATTFEVFSVASMGGGIVSGLLTSSISKKLHITRTDYSQLWLLFVVSIAAKLVPIFLAYLLPERRSSYGGEGHCEYTVVVVGGEASDTTADAEGAAR